MAQLLSQVAVGTTVKINENGNPVDYIVVHQGNPSTSLYDASCNGTWVLRKNIYTTYPWKSPRAAAGYDQSNINGSLSTWYNNLFDERTKRAIKQVKIPYGAYNGSTGYEVVSGENGLLTHLFILGVKEMFPRAGGATFIDGVTLSYFSDNDADKRKSIYAGNYNYYWTRTPATNGVNLMYAQVITPSGTSDKSFNDSTYGVRWAFILQSDMAIMEDDGTLTFAPNAPETITAPDLSMQNQPADISWSAVDGADGYILERNADNGGWTQIYSGANLTYTDTIGTWSTVQYRVKAGISDVYGDYTTSEAISVVAASALVISGTDSDLGTLTAPVGYSVSSDTGNTITVTEEVNGVILRTYTATSGQQQSIAIPDLPTGSGSIVITASVQASSGAVNQTRTWSYTKTAPTFPSGPFDISTLSKSGKKQFPLTLAEAVKMPLGLSMAGLLNGNITDLSGNPVGVQIETGSYVGTGTYGQNNPNTLTFEFVPMILVISSITADAGIALISNSVGSTWVSGHNGLYLLVASTRGKTIDWYSDSDSSVQMNSSGRNYHYAALGTGGGG